MEKQICEACGCHDDNHEGCILLRCDAVQPSSYLPNVNLEIHYSAHKDLLSNYEYFVSKTRKLSCLSLHFPFNNVTSMLCAESDVNLTRSDLPTLTSVE